jgi:hypothetical protein
MDVKIAEQSGIDGERTVGQSISPARHLERELQLAHADALP